MLRTVKVAIVGSGLAGLTATHLLEESKNGVEFEVHLFEKVGTIVHAMLLCFLTG
jgi:protoporphyrinogen oxidase